MFSKKYFKRFCMLFMTVLIIFASSIPGWAYTNSKDLFKAHENSTSGLPIYNNTTVTVQGIVTVPTGVWHDTANYFSIVTEDESYRFAGGVAVYLGGSTSPTVSIGDKVVVTGTLSNAGYSTDTGTTVIKPSSSSGITVIGSNYELPKAYPIYTDADYNDLELDLGYRFEGMPVRIMGKVHNYDNVGTLIGFDVDGSSDGNLTDGNGAMNVKIYSYSGIDISGIANGDLVVIEGVLFQSDSTSPYYSGYYIRPTKQVDIIKINQNTNMLLSEIMRKDANCVPILNGITVTVNGIASVDTGEWNSASNAFTLLSQVPVAGIDPVYPEGAVYVYQTGSLTPSVSVGDDVTVTGAIGIDGYDYGTVVIKPGTITVNNTEQDVLTEKLIRSNETYSTLSAIESMPVKLQGKVYNIDNIGVTRGFDLDASSNYNWDDQSGMISIKFYDYSGIDISSLTSGDLLTVRGILQKNDTASPYDGGYFIRLRQQEDIVKRSENTRRTVYIHLDAFRNDYIGRSGWDTSNLDSLISNGTRCIASYGEYVSMTTANMTTLVTGSHTATHNVPALAFYDKASDRRVRYLQNYNVDTVGEVFQKAGLLTASVMQRKLQNRGADIMMDGGTISEIRDDAIEVINNEDPDLLVILFNQTDSVAHTYGTNSTQIEETVEEVDDAIGSIINALDNKGILDDTNIIVASDHSMFNVGTNITSALTNTLDSTGIEYEYATIDMGPFNSNTKLVCNLSGGAAQIYYRRELTSAEENTLINALSGITGINMVYTREQLDNMNTSANLGDLVVDCSEGYAFSSSFAEHGSYAQTQTFLVFYGPDIKAAYTNNTRCGTVDIVPTIYYLNTLTAPSTVDGMVLTDIIQ
mgnify:CR=1 FL=1